MLYYQMCGFMEGDRPKPDLGLHLPPPERAALFLDFDGTLVEIAETPDGIEIPDAVPELLGRAMERLDGRVALVSGRSVADLERMLPGFEGTLIGSHGAERRVDGRTEHAAEFDETVIATLQRMTRDFASLKPAFLVEPKPTGVVLHYRQAQEHGALALHFMEALAQAADGFRLQPALCAYEIKPDNVGKDVALAALWEGPAFEGCVPIYAGDDLTDEPALDWAQRQGGLAIKLGRADSVAEHRLPGPAALHARLAGWLG